MLKKVYKYQAICDRCGKESSVYETTSKREMPPYWDDFYGNCICPLCSLKNAEEELELAVLNRPNYGVKELKCQRDKRLENLRLATFCKGN